MSWQLAAFGLLGVGIAAGFAWYERTAPDARTVALVGTLAALACLGRVAFAAVPNVKPTTDIVLISGYALGGAPGYAVGAVAALTSNFFFGQGPWTPWQMAGWGLTGICGALLARLSRGRIGRRPLTAVCFVIGFWFTALQDGGDWVTYSDHSLGQLGAYVGQGLGYDLIHAVGCAGFAVVFGPAMIRTLQRFRRRLEVRWVAIGDGAGAAALLGAVLLGGMLTAAPPPARAATTQTPIQYLVSAQNGDGGFGSSPGQASNPMVSGWVVLALAATGHQPLDVSKRAGAASAGAYLKSSVRHDLGDPGSLERTILAAHAAGIDPSNLGGHDLPALLLRRFRHDGSLAEQTNLTAFGVLALRAAGMHPPRRAIPWLLDQQDRDGGFNFATRGGGSDVDDTAAVLEALATAGRSAPTAGSGTARGSGSPNGGRERATIARALAFLRAQQRRDGGFPSQPGAESNSQSTAFAIQGLIAVGASPGAMHRPGGRSPLQYLAALTQSNGAVRYSRSSDQTPVWVTAEAALALAGHPLPVAAVPPARTTTPGGGAGSATKTSSTTNASTTTPAGSSTRSRGGRRGATRRHDAQPRSGPRTQAAVASMVTAVVRWLGRLRQLMPALAGI